MSCKSKDKRHHCRQLGPMELDVDYGALQISILSIQSKTFNAYITRLHTVQVLSIAQVANLKLISEKRSQQTGMSHQTFVLFFQ